MTRTVGPGDREWPELLVELGGARPVNRLNVMGGSLPDPVRSIAIVGTRRPTSAGMRAAAIFARACVEAKFTVVSGLALGIDTVAHREALRAGGQTVAVLGCGFGHVYPKENHGLRAEIVTKGTLVTEHEVDAPPHAHHFPLRNRIIMGLSIGVLVVEGGHRSGALITARLALDANRSIWAVPGSIRNPMAKGPNELIRTGQAALVTEAGHIFDELAPGLVWREGAEDSTKDRIAVTDGERRVLDLLDDVPVTLEHIGRSLGEPHGKLALDISRLEVRGFLLRRGEGYEITNAGNRARSAPAG